jgi:hypothetical protein
VAQRRAAGQLLAASARIYALNWRLFLGIGLLYLPVMALAGAAHWSASSYYSHRMAYRSRSSTSSQGLCMPS